MSDLRDTTVGIEVPDSSSSRDSRLRPLPANSANTCSN